MATWAAGHASVGVVPLAGGHAHRVVRDVHVTFLWRRWSWVSTWNYCSGAPFFLLGSCHGVLTLLAHPSRVKSQIWLAELDDGVVFGCRDLLGGIIFIMLGATLDDAWPTGWVDVFGSGLSASATSLLLAACLSPWRLKCLDISFGSNFLPVDVDQVVIASALSGAIMMVPSSGSPDLV
jgi:hypothetical protein